MARHAWILVEWVDESNVFPSYGIVNADTLPYNESDLYPGNQIVIRMKHDNPRRAQILRTSDSKRYVKQHKEALERQDQQVKNLVQLCMRTIKEIKSKPVYLKSMDDNQQLMGCQNTSSHVLTNRDNSSSDKESEENNPFDRSKMTTKSTVKYISQPQYTRVETNGCHSRFTATQSPITHQQSHSIMSSTPLPGRSAQKITKLCFDQGTQTDNLILQVPLTKLEELEEVLKNLYRRFESLLTKMNPTQLSSDTSESGEVSYIEPSSNESSVGHNNVNYIEPHNTVQVEDLREASAEQIIEESHPESNESNNHITFKTETDRSANTSTICVRRMSAQTTNNVESISNNAQMVPIGNGNALVPARLLNEIDWNSHSTATRRLLQAIFPRRVLATHSLTGKQSPAFMDKPAKKILNPKLVNDIVKTVSSRCGVPNNLVRNSITIKCTDESKLYSKRQCKRGLRPSHQNEENIPLSPLPTSDESNVTN